VDIVVQIPGAQEQWTGIAISQVTDDGFEEGDLEGPTDIIDPETAPPAYDVDRRTGSTRSRNPADSGSDRGRY
jgi:hypothetical protein